MKFLCDIKDRTIKPSNEFEFNRILDLLEGKVATVEIKKKRKIRSIPQNKYYWKCVIYMLDKYAENGYTKEEYHEMLKYDCLGHYEKGGRTFISSTSDLNTMEFEEYLTKCRRWAQVNCDLYIPLPNEYINYVNRGDLPQ